MKTLANLLGLLVIIALIVGIAGAVLAAYGAVVYFVWNAAFPDYAVTFWQAFAIASLSSVLFGGSAACKCR